MGNGADSERRAWISPLPAVPARSFKRDGEELGPLGVIEPERVGHRSGNGTGRHPLSALQPQQVLGADADGPCRLAQSEAGTQPGGAEHGAQLRRWDAASTDLGHQGRPFHELTGR